MERLIRSVNTVLYEILPSRSPTDELLLNLLHEGENVINSRPHVAHVPDEDDVYEAVTPNHFLVRSFNGLKTLSGCTDSGVVLKQSWCISQQYANIC